MCAAMTDVVTGQQEVTGLHMYLNRVTAKEGRKSCVLQYFELSPRI